MNRLRPHPYLATIGERLAGPAAVRERLVPRQNYDRSTGAVEGTTILDGSMGQSTGVDARSATATPEKVEAGGKVCNASMPSSDGGPIPGTAGSIAPCTNSLFAPAPQEPDRASAAGASLTPAAFDHFTESCPAAALTDGQVRAAPDGGPSGAAVPLSDAALILLRAIAAYERRDNESALLLALATHAQKIGLGPLARAVLDEIGR